MAKEKLPRRIKPLGQERPRKGALPVSTPPSSDRDPAKLLGPTERQDYEAAVLAGATSFVTVVRRKGRAHERADCTTLAEACVAAGSMGVEDSMIYAVNDAGRSVLVLAGGKRVRNEGKLFETAKH